MWMLPIDYTPELPLFTDGRSWDVGFEAAYIGFGVKNLPVQVLAEFSIVDCITVDLDLKWVRSLINGKAIAQFFVAHLRHMIGRMVRALSELPLPPEMGTTLNFTAVDDEDEEMNRLLPEVREMHY
ncbi:hypothetical protein ACLOJK_018546 [Asimina triloba]